MMRANAIAAAVLAMCLASRAALASQAYTDTSDVHACITRNGTTLIATGGGVVVTKDGASRVLTVLDGLPDTRAYALLASADGIWVGTDGGAVLLGERYEAKRTALDTSVRALAFWNGDVLAGTFGRGVADLTTGTSFAPPPDMRVLSLASRDGALEIGTMGGVFRRNGTTYASLSSEPILPAPPAGCTVPTNGLPSNDVNAVVADGQTVWVGTFDRGLARLENGRFRAIEGVDRRIDALALDKKASRLWVGTARGLYAVDGGAGHLIIGGDEVHALAPLDGGGVLAGTSHGALLVRDTVTHVGAKEGVDVSSVTAVLARGEQLLLGTTGGLFVGSGARFERLSVASGHLPDDWVTALAVHDGAVYAGTYNAGVVRLEKNATGWHAQRLGGGYINPAGLTLAGDGSTLYAATMDGLMTSDGRAALVRRDRSALGQDVTGVAVSSLGTFIASRRGLLRL
jgi:ligand-binding sensor domain-containing protein